MAEAKLSFRRNREKMTIEAADKGRAVFGEDRRGRDAPTRADSEARGRRLDGARMGALSGMRGATHELAFGRREDGALDKSRMLGIKRRVIFAREIDRPGFIGFDDAFERELTADFLLETASTFVTDPRAPAGFVGLTWGGREVFTRAACAERERQKENGKSEDSDLNGVQGGEVHYAAKARWGVKQRAHDFKAVLSIQNESHPDHNASSAA